MRKIKEVLRLKWEVGLSARQIARSLSVSHSTVLDLLRRFELSELTWPLPEIDDTALEAKLYPGNPVTWVERPLPDMAYIHSGATRPQGGHLADALVGVQAESPRRAPVQPVLPALSGMAGQAGRRAAEPHRAGERMQVDFADAVPVHNRETGEVLQAQIFIAVLPASNYTFAKAFPSQDLRSWILGPLRRPEAPAGVPEIIVLDNPKAGVSRACRDQPDLNPTYQEMARHYGVGVISRDPTNRRIRPKSRMPCWSWSGGSWRPCVIAPSSASTS